MICKSIGFFTIGSTNNLLFEFDEGDAASIRQINLVGNELFSDEA